MNVWVDLTYCCDERNEKLPTMRRLNAKFEAHLGHIGKNEVSIAVVVVVVLVVYGFEVHNNFNRIIGRVVVQNLYAAVVRNCG